MAFTLYPHRSDCYDAAARLLERQGRAALIHSTGTGKSHIAFRPIKEHPLAAILWMAPSEYMFRMQRENLRRSTQSADCPMCFSAPMPACCMTRERLTGSISWR